VEAPAILVKEKGDSFKGEAISKGTSSIDSSDEGSMEESEDEEAVEIVWEEELISSLAELRKERRKNEHLRHQLLKYEEADESDDAILKVQLEGALKMEQILMNQLEEKENICDAQEDEIMSLKDELQKTTKATEQEEEISKENQSLKGQCRRPKRKFKI
jgi:hypothetical protein